MPVRASELGQALPAANTLTDLFTVPAGFTYLVKSVYIWNSGGPTDTVHAYAKDTFAFGVTFFYQQSLATLVTMNVQTYVALGPGVVFRIFSSLGTTYFWVSGTKLPGVA